MTPAFEQFARSKGWSLLHKGETGEYRALNTQAGWLAWQAREVPAGVVVVPLEPADDMLIRGGEAFFDAARVACNGDTLADQDNAGSIYRAMLVAAPQPASKPEPEWPLLDADAKVGNGTFRKGVSSRFVVLAAQRQAAYAAEDASEREPECGNGCACLTQCGDSYDHAGISAPDARHVVRQAVAAPGWITGRSPDWTDNNSIRVIACTEGHDFGGVQVHDIPASDFHYFDPEGDGEVGTEVARVVTRWMYRDNFMERAARLAPNEDAERWQYIEEQGSQALAEFLGSKYDTLKEFVDAARKQEGK